MTKEKIKHYIIYFVFGVLTTLVSFGTLWALIKIFPNTDENILNTISIIIAMIFAYFVNRKYVFKSIEKNKIKEFIKFAASRAASAIFEIVFFWILSRFELFHFVVYKLIYPYLNNNIELANELCIMLDKFIVSFFVMIINYILSRFLVFKDNSSIKEERN